METSILSDMFELGVPLLEKIARPVLVYFFLIAGLRLAGKRELAQLNPFDLVVLLVLSNTVQNAIIGNDTSVTGGLVGAATLLVLNYLVVRFLSRHERLERIVGGEEDVLIAGGSVREDRLRAETISRTELEIAAHKQGFASLDEVDRAVLEPSGAVSFTGRRPEPEVGRHREILSRLEEISRELAGLKASLNPPRP